MPVYTEDWCKEAVQKYFNKDTKVVMIPFSFKESIDTNEKFVSLYDKVNGKYYDFNSKFFFDLGVKEDNFKLINFFDKGAVLKAKELIQESDVLFFPGGLPDAMYDRIKEYGIYDEVKNYKGITIGYSAGAMVQLGTYHISPDGDYPEYLMCEGLGYVRNFDVEVHYENSEVQLASMKRAKSEHGMNIYTITNNGLIIIDNGNIECFGEVEKY